MIRISSAKIQGIDAGTGCRFDGRTYEFTHQVTLFTGCFAIDYSSRRIQNTNLLNCLDIGLNALIKRIQSPRITTKIPKSLVYPHAEKASVTIALAKKHPIYENSFYTWTICHGRNNILTGLHLLAEKYREVITEGDFSLPLLIKYSSGLSNLSLKIGARNPNLTEFDAYKSFPYSLLSVWLIKRQSMVYENCLSPESIEFLRSELSTELADKIIKKNDERIDKRLRVVRETISKFIPYIRDIRVVGKSELAATIYTDCTFTDQQFGLIDIVPEKEKQLIALIGDICARLSILNPESENPLLGEGIILIDQIDLIIPDYWKLPDFYEALGDTFPNCQFILSNWGRKSGEVVPIVNLGKQY